MSSETLILVALLSFTIGFLSCYFLWRSDIRKSGDDDDDDEEEEMPYKEAHKYPTKDEMKMVLVIRTDLQMGKGKVAAQCSHATLAAYKKAETHSEITRKWIKRWEDYGTTKITLKCNDEVEMLALQKDARSSGLIACSIQDAGRTQIAAGSRTVLAIGPGPKTLLDKITGHLKLY